jgi:hypothetical protein
MQFRDAPGGVPLWERGDCLIAINLANERRRVEVGGCYTAVCTTRARDGERIEARLELPRMQGAVLVQAERPWAETNPSGPAVEYSVHLPEHG